MATQTSTDEIATIYDELLKTYQTEWESQGHRSLHLAYYDEDHDEPAQAAINTMRVLSEAAGVDESDRILNIGCGAGEDSVWTARAYGATVVGVNISDRQLELARENAREHDVESLTTFANDDFHELDTIEDESMDLVWGLEALSHAIDRPQALRQCHRVLDQDGRVAFTDLFIQRDLSENESETVSFVNEALGLQLGQIDQFETDLAAAGFTDIEIRDLTDGITDCTERRRRFSRLFHPFGRILSFFGRMSNTQLDAMRASARIHELVIDGALGYNLVTANRTEQ